MSVFDRIVKAEKDLALQDYENALIQVLIAVAATSRKRYPYPQYKDREAFIKYLKEEHFQEKLLPVIRGGCIRFQYRNDLVDIETFLYECIRCNLLHEAELVSNLKFIEQDEGGFCFSVQDGIFTLSWNLIAILKDIVKTSSENEERLA